MPGLLLGADGRPLRRDRARMFVPAGMEDDAPLVGHCRVCGAKFYRGDEQRWQQHVVRCANERLDELRAMAPSERNRGTPFDEQMWEPDVVEHYAKVRARMEAEGRWEIRPNEVVNE